MIFEEKTKELICVEIRARYRHLVGAFTPKYTAESRLKAWREIFEFSQTIPEGKLKIESAAQLKGFWQKWKQNLQNKVANEGSTGAEPASDLRESEKQIWHIVHEFHKHALEFKVAHYLYHEFLLRFYNTDIYLGKSSRCLELAYEAKFFKAARGGRV